MTAMDYNVVPAFTTAQEHIPGRSASPSPSVRTMTEVFGLVILQTGERSDATQGCDGRRLYLHAGQAFQQPERLLPYACR
jgi:hypothetical protein